MNHPTSTKPESRRQRPEDQPVSQADLIDMAVETNAETFAIVTPQLDRTGTAILGKFNNTRCRSGLYVHATDTVEAHDLSAEWVKPPACTIAIMLEGELDVRFDDVALHLGPDTNKGEAGPTGHIWSLTETTRLVRNSRKGTRVRKVMITVPWDWIHSVLEDKDLPHDNLAEFARSHRSHLSWRPSAHALALAEQIVNASRAAPALADLSVESRAIEIAREALECLIEAAPEAAPCRAATKMQIKAQAVRAYVRDHLDDNPTLNAMGHELGMSVGAMQSAFKSVYGRTIADYSRELRLERARDAIERDGVSVAQAAYEAGYSNPANFSTAFKRQFGLNPSTVRP